MAAISRAPQYGLGLQVFEETVQSYVVEFIILFLGVFLDEHGTSR